MSCSGTTTCNDDARRASLLAARGLINGIESVEIVPKPVGDPLIQRVLAVYFFKPVPPGLDNSNLRRFTLTGGVRVPGSKIRVQNATVSEGRLELVLDRYGDFSDYALHIDHPDLDPVYACRRFNFKVDCPNPFDCVPLPRPDTSAARSPTIDYQCRDYSSFRRALLEFLPTRASGFSETNEADLAVTIAELFAHAGDVLSYMQDAVANEAWLSTARQPQSVRRHALLLDYRMHAGAAAQAAVHFNVSAPVIVPRGTQVTTAGPDPRSRIVFETLADIECDDQQNEIRPYTWLNHDCCLPAGATSADFEGQVSIPPGRMLLIEEALGPVRRDTEHVALAADAADPRRRQVVTVVASTLLVDPVPEPPMQVTRISWREQDALQFEFCTRRDESGQPATVARGNLVWSSHGSSVRNEQVQPGRALAEGPLTWLAPADTLDPRNAKSMMEITVNGQPWREEPTLLDAGPNDVVFTVELDADAHGIVRFGDGQLGRAVAAGSDIRATYRVGSGSAGNVGPDSLTVLGAPLMGVSVRNPLAAQGGTDPEPIENVRRAAPEAFRRVQYRAVTAADYSRAAATVPGVSNAVATFRWTGSWLTVFIGVDPIGRTGLPQALREAVTARLDSWRQAGYDVEIRPPVYVPLKIELHICVLPEYFAADVLRAVQDALSSGTTTAGTPGFFHPDNFTFGQSLFLSRLYSAVQAVPGVKAVRALTFKRLNRPDYDEMSAGLITAGTFEVLRLDNDRNQPDNGVLRLWPEGGK